MKISNIFFLVLIVLVFSKNINAQNTSDTIRVDYSFWGNSYFIGDTEYSKGEIKDKLKANNNSMDHYDSYKCNKIFGYITLAGGLVLTGSALLQTWASYNNYDISPLATNQYQTDNTKFIITAALALVFDITNVIFFINSDRHFDKAIQSYNKGTTTSNLDIDLKFGYNKIGIVLHLN